MLVVSSQFLAGSVYLLFCSFFSWIGGFYCYWQFWLSRCQFILSYCFSFFCSFCSVIAYSSLFWQFHFSNWQFILSYCQFILSYWKLLLNFLVSNHRAGVRVKTAPVLPEFSFFHCRVWKCFFSKIIIKLTFKTLQNSLYGCLYF